MEDGKGKMENGWELKFPELRFSGMKATCKVKANVFLAHDFNRGEIKSDAQILKESLFLISTP